MRRTWILLLGGWIAWTSACGGEDAAMDAADRADPEAAAGANRSSEDEPSNRDSGKVDGPRGTGDGSDGGTDAGNPPAPSGGGDPVGACAPECTGTKMCDDTGACVCAPGWVASGSDCVAAPVSALDTRTKAEVCARYKADTAPVSPHWIGGNNGTCDPGTVPYEAQVAALRYLNFYRWMVGLGPVQVKPSVAKQVQECSKILNYSFSHAPSASTTCYTKEGADGCGASLIAKGYGLVKQFDGYGMEIHQNLAHRRNILRVGRAGVWTGVSGAGSAMHYGGTYKALASDPELVAHPGPGFNVRSRVPKRWFVQRGTKAIGPVDARVTEVSTGKSMPMKRYHYFNDFSSFDLDGWTPAVNVAYLVELVNKDGQVLHSFKTTLIDCP